MQTSPRTPETRRRGPNGRFLPRGADRTTTEPQFPEATPASAKPVETGPVETAPVDLVPAQARPADPIFEPTTEFVMTEESEARSASLHHCCSEPKGKRTER